MYATRFAPIAALVLLAGCVTPPEPAGEVLAAGTEEAAGLVPFELAGKQCTIAGFVAAYAMDRGGPQTLAKVWVLADIREEIGNPTHDAVGLPVTGPLFGNWHMGVVCDSVATSAGDEESFIFGFVGDIVEAPEWDEGGADLHFLLSGFGFANGTIGDAARNSTVASLTRTSKVQIDWYTPKELPRSSAYVAMLDAEKGLYESWSTLAPYRALEPRTIRLWWQVPVDGHRDKHAHEHAGQGSITSFGTDVPVEGEFHPISWDLHLSGGQQYTTPPVDGVEVGSHNMFAFEHGPVPAQPCLTNLYENDALSLSAATIATDVVLDQLWTH